MGKWSAFLVSLIPAGLAGFLCFLLVTTGLPAAEEMGTLFWGPLVAGFLGCVMCMLAPLGIAIFVKSAPKKVAANKAAASDEKDFAVGDSEMLSGEEDEFESSEEEFVSDDDMASNDFATDDNDWDSQASTNYETAEFASDEFSDEFDVFDEEEDQKR